MPGEGLVIDATGAVTSPPPAPCTVTPMIAEVVLAPRLSVARAVRLRAPVPEGVQLTPYGALLSVPIAVVPSRNCTELTVPSESAAFAVMVTGTPVVTVAPFVGAVIATVGGTFAAPTSVNVAVSVAAAAGA